MRVHVDASFHLQCFMLFLFSPKEKKLEQLNHIFYYRPYNLWNPDFFVSYNITELMSSSIIRRFSGMKNRLPNLSNLQ